MTIKFCIQCAAPLTKQTETAYICSNGHPFWNNPKPTASVLFLRNGKFLASKRAIEPFKGKYDIPGGFLEYGENAYAAAIREMQEETGVIISDLSLLEVYNSEYQELITTCDVVFVAHTWEGEFIANDDAEELVWMPVESLDSDQFAWHYPGLVAKLSAIPDNT